MLAQSTGIRPTRFHPARRLRDGGYHRDGGYDLPLLSALLSTLSSLLSQQAAGMVLQANRR